MLRGQMQVDRVLVTGASGFIGRCVVDLLVRAGFEVHATSTRPIAGNGPEVRWHQVDLLDATASRELVGRVRAGHLAHLAWITAPADYRDSPQNVEWAAASAELVRHFTESGGRRALLAGTCMEYATSELPCHETSTPLEPSTLYGESKLSLWHAVERVGDQRGLSIAWARIFHLYGPHEHPGRFVPSVIGSLLAGRQARCTSGEALRDFSHVADVARALARLLTSEIEGPINVASGRAVRVSEVAKTIGDLLGRADLVQLGALPPPADEQPRIEADVTRLRAELGFDSEFDLQSGLTDTIAWWRSRQRLLCTQAPHAPFAQQAERLNS